MKPLYKSNKGSHLFEIDRSAGRRLKANTRTMLATAPRTRRRPRTETVKTMITWSSAFPVASVASMFRFCLVSLGGQFKIFSGTISVRFSCQSFCIKTVQNYERNVQEFFL